MIEKFPLINEIQTYFIQYIENLREWQGKLSESSL